MGISRKISGCVLELVKGNIVQQDTEAIVNAANKRLAPGGGVAGVIHRAAGPGLWEECKKLRGCETGEAKITSGHRLKAKYVIHTVGPIYSGSPRDPEDLRACYLNSLRVAEKNGIKSISFPAISTGAFGYPIEDAAKVSLGATVEYLRKGTGLKLARFVLYSQPDYESYVKTFESL